MSADITKDLSFEVIKDSYIGCFKKFFVLNGRARRREFWLFCLINVILGLIPGINFIVGIATCIPSFTVGVRRLHDINKSGKYMLLAFVPLVGVLIMGIGTIAGMGRGGGLFFFLIIILLASLVPLILLLVWFAKDGTHGSNQYGPDPKVG